MSTQNIPKRPWNSIAESVVPETGNHLDYQAALDSPCKSCPTSPCCTHLPLTTFVVRNISELDYAIYLLNFERIEVGVSNTGNWSAYYSYPCRFLDKDSFFCTIHNQPEQPQICARYNPYQCWYKRALTKTVTPEYIRLDRPRLQYLISCLRFDELGNIVEEPVWENLLRDLENLSFEPSMQPSEGESEEDSEDSIAELSRFPEKLTMRSESWFSFEELKHPCEDCQAYCCKSLLFPQDPPVDVSTLDYFKFCLGFPGVALGISDNGWCIVLKTRCRNLEDNRCTLFGMPERPLACKYYDEWKCSYKAQFGCPESVGFLSIGLEHFQPIVKSIRFNENGVIVSIPTTEEMRRQLSIH